MRRTEEQLALSAGAGDEVAFAQLCRTMRGWLHQRAGRFYAPGLEHDDLMQEARIALFIACRGWDRDRSPLPFLAFAAVVVDRRLATALTTALRGKHRPLNGSLRLEHQRDEDGATLAEVLPAPACTDPAVIVEARLELRVVLDAVRGFTPTEQAVLRRRLNGASHREAGRGLGTGNPAKVADNALARGRRRIAEALEAAA